MKIFFYSLLLVGTLLPFGLTAQLADLGADTTEAFSEAEMIAYFEAYKDSIESTLTFYSDTTVSIGDGLALLAIPAGYRFVGPEDAYTVLVDMWGNPPDNGTSSLGMLFPDKYGPAATEGYGIGALIAGKVIAKTGLLAGLGIFFAKAWKLLAVAGVALTGLLKKLGGRDS